MASVVEPDLRGVCAAFNRAGAPYVVIGGFAVIANSYVRATRDVDLLVPDDPAALASVLDALAELSGRERAGGVPDAERVRAAGGGRYDTAAGEVDVLLEGVAPLDFAEVRATALEVDLDGETVVVCDLAHLVAFKRLSDRPSDRADLSELRAIHGELPHLELPGLDP